MEGIVNNLIQALEEFNIEESIYWAHLLARLSPEERQLNLTLLNQFFKGFYLKSEELSRIISNLIWDTLKNEDFPVIYEKFRNELLTGLQCFDDEIIVKLCLRIIFQLGKGHEIDEELLKKSLNLLLIENYSISSYLIEALPLDNQKISDELIKLYLRSNITDSIIKFRFIEVLSKSVTAPSLSNINELKETFFKEIKMVISSPYEDVLMTANVIQIIQDCVDRRDQFDRFLSEGIISLLLNLIDSDNSAISSKVLDFLANCAIKKCFDHEFVESNGLDRNVSQICEETSNESEKVSAVFCLMAIATLSRNSQNILESFYENFVLHAISSVQLSALNGIGIYFRCSDSGASYSFLLHLYSKKFFEWLIEKINSTFDEEKSSAYFTLKSMLSTKENLKFVLDNTTIFSILLQRNLDSSQVGLKWKFGILEQVHGNRELFDCLNDPLKEQVTKYLGQGVTFVPKMTRVAFESAD